MAGHLVLALPSVYILLTVIDQRTGELGAAVTWFGAAMLIVCLPYLFMTVARFANPEIVEVERHHLMSRLLAIVLVISAA